MCPVHDAPPRDPGRNCNVTHYSRELRDRISNQIATAANVEPSPMIIETVCKPWPAVNSKPASIGASTEPPRPIPIANPVPVARVLAG